MSQLVKRFWLWAYFELHIFDHRTCFPSIAPSALIEPAQDNQKDSSLYPDLAIVHSTFPGAPAAPSAANQGPKRLKPLKSEDLALKIGEEKDLKRRGSKTGLGGQQEPAVETPKPKRTAAKAKTDSKAGKGNPEAEEVESRKEKQQDKLDGKKEPEQVMPKKTDQGTKQKENKESQKTKNSSDPKQSKKDKEKEVETTPVAKPAAKAKAKPKAKARGKPTDEEEEPPGDIVDPNEVAEQSLNRADTQELLEKEKARKAYKARKERFYRSMASFGLRSFGKRCI